MVLILRCQWMSASECTDAVPLGCATPEWLWRGFHLSYALNGIIYEYKYYYRRIQFLKSMSKCMNSTTATSARLTGSVSVSLIHRLIRFGGHLKQIFYRSPEKSLTGIECGVLRHKICFIYILSDIYFYQILSFSLIKWVKTIKSGSHIESEADIHNNGKKCNHKPLIGSHGFS